jgi:glycosyltransferase involved in cell wall biosynthesis
MQKNKLKKIAILHDWLEKKAGAESVLEQILKIYPQADLFTLVDFMKPEDRAFLKGRNIKTSFIQLLPYAKRSFRIYFPLFPIAVTFFNLKKYDLVISSSHSFVKNILKQNSSQIHICYCYTPIRYCYDMKKDYIKDYSANLFVKIALKVVLNFIALWDRKMTKGVDYFISISRHIQKRIQNTYKKNSTIIYPSINFEKFSTKTYKKEDYFVAASRFVPYKKIDLIIKTFNQLKDKKLIIIGDGEKYLEYKLLAKSKNIKFVGWVSENEKIKIFSKAKALIYPAFEDFGIVPVEAQACGTPVIAFGKGGVKDTVIHSGNHKTGIFFNRQSVRAIKKSIIYFEKNLNDYKSQNCKKNAASFDHIFFQNKMKDFFNNFLINH